MAFSRIDFSITGGIARITLAEPGNHNTIDLDVTREFAEAAVRCETEPGIKVVLLSARGDVFSFGGDLNAFVTNKDHMHAYIREMAKHLHAAILMLDRLPAPVIAAVNGMAAGGGFSLVCMSDMAIAKRSATFNAAYTRSGLTPDCGMTYFLTRRVGPQRAFDITATNPTLSADDAKSLGIVARVVDDELFENEVEDLVRQLAARPSVLGPLKRLLKSAALNSLEQQLELEAKSIATRAASPETMEILEAFLARHKT
jgi:2-(1,2-epoxy-1,2-dihydrophenyl)acetyl-CoA isomerase